MSVYVLVSQAGQPIFKEAYFGDVSKLNDLIAARQAKDPTLTFQLFADETDPVYANTVVKLPLTQAQKDWAAFKAQQPAPTALQAILYLARYLGLE